VSRSFVEVDRCFRGSYCRHQQDDDHAEDEGSKHLITLKMDAVSTSETSLDLYEITLLSIPQVCRHVCLKLKLSHYTPWRRLEEGRYSSYLFSTSALDGGEWSASRPGRSLAPGKGPPVPIVEEAGWAPEPVWTQRLQEKSFGLCRESNLDGQVIQPVARHCTDWATLAHITSAYMDNMCTPFDLQLPALDIAFLCTLH
jgi:hypothetical protein